MKYKLGLDKDYDIEIEKFVENPTEITRSLIWVIKKANSKYISIFKPNNAIKNLISNIKLRLWYQSKYKEIYNLIRVFDVPSLQRNKPIENIKNLFNKFEKICDVISLNNLLLVYGFLTERNKSVSLINKEDEKLLYFKKFYNNEISIKEFKKRYGHYGLNAFELSSPRFCEYNKTQLRNLGKYLKDFKFEKGRALDDYMELRSKNLFSLYSTLREELRYLLLIIIKDLRFELLKLGKEKKIKNIFNLSYKEVVNLKK